jgi:low affinity Fe/Cu permease
MKVNKESSALQPRALKDHRSDILIESALVLSTLALAVWLAERRLPAWSSNTALNAAVSTTVVLIVSILLLGTVMFVLKVRGERLLRREEQLKPAVIELLTTIAQGEADEIQEPAEELARLHRRAPRAVDELLSESLALQKGEGNRRLAAAAQVSGIASTWRRLVRSRSAELRCHAITYLGRLPSGAADEELRAGLEDAEELVAAEAARALINSGRMEDIQKVFDELPRQSTLVRALMSDWLRRHSAALAAGAISRALESDDPARIVPALDLLVNWKRMLPVPGVGPLLRSENGAIQARAFRALPYAMGAAASREDFEAGLQSEDKEVLCAVLSVTARMGMTSLAPRVANLVLDADLNIATAAAYALANAGLTGELERIIIGGAPKAAGIATEALEKYRIGRLLR